MRLYNLTSLFVLLLAFNFDAKAYTIFSSYGNCETWNKYIEEEKDNPYGGYDAVLSSWLAGFISSLNMYSGEENFPNLDLATIKEYVENYCVKNPTDKAYNAVLEVIKKNKVK